MKKDSDEFDANKANKDLLRKAIEIVKKPNGLNVAAPFDLVLKYGSRTGNCVEINEFVAWLLQKKEISRAFRLANVLKRQFTPAEMNSCLETAIGWNAPTFMELVEKYQARPTENQVIRMLQAIRGGFVDTDKTTILENIKKLVALFPASDNAIYLAMAICLAHRKRGWAKELIDEFNPSEKMRNRLLSEFAHSSVESKALAELLLGRTSTAGEAYLAELDGLKSAAAAVSTYKPRSLR